MIMRKFALGIHHFNIAYTAGNEMSYHRQVRESISPFLDMLLRHPTWCFSVEMSGFSLEFIAVNYPAVFSLLKLLITNKRIELISSTYSPQIWLAFPELDLIKSIEINNELLNKYGISQSRIFFSQENFFGEGIKTLSKWFDVAIVKEDYYSTLYNEPLTNIKPYYLLGEIKLLIGWGHILESISDLYFSKNAEMYEKETLLNSNYALLKSASETSSKSPFKTYVGVHKSIEWKWFHIGSSERFTKPQISPSNPRTCQYDLFWSANIENMLVNIENEGYVFAGIRHFINTIDDFEPEPCGPLLDGSWNMIKSQGGFVWTGLNHSVHEDCLLVRNINWRSRTQLLGVETLINILKEKMNIAEFNSSIIKAWKFQLLAEISDATGWFPEKCEVLFGIQQSENVLNLITQMVAIIKLKFNIAHVLIDTMDNCLLERADFYSNTERRILKSKKLFIKEPLITGGDGQMKFYQLNDMTQIIIGDYLPCASSFNILFEFNNAYLNYSPALMEASVVNWPLAIFKANNINLALPNGLIGINEELFLIKHNQFLNISGQINKSLKQLNFEIYNPPSYNVHFVFTVFKGVVGEALDLANRINIFPTVSI